MNATMRLSCGVWLAAMLAGCTSAPSKPEAVAHMIQPQRVTEHRGHDDLLTAGLGKSGLAVATALELDLPEAAIASGLAGATWPARKQRLSAGPYGEMARAAVEQGGAELWLDGGHNPHAGRALAGALAERQRKAPRPLALIVGMLANKDHGGFFEALKASEAHVFTVGFEGSAAEPEALAAVARGHGLGAQAAESVEAALERALRLGAGRVVICGSLYLAGEVLGASPETWPR